VEGLVDMSSDPVNVIIPYKKSEDVKITNPRTGERVSMTLDEWKFLVQEVKSGKLDPENWTQED
jgi:hypothetical protein